MGKNNPAKNLKIALLQTPLEWENRERNIKNFSIHISKIRKGTADIIMLPEMFNTGFTMNVKSCAETMKGDTVSWMLDQAQIKNAVVCGSLIINEKGRYYNRFVWVQPDKKVFHYSKRHLFRMAREHQYFSAGEKRIIIDWKGWKVCPLVCYDLRFPVWSRNTEQYDLLLYVANWPARRKFAWSQLLIARAIENQCYVAGLNRVGKDGKGISYSGNSVVLDPFGIKISAIPASKACVQTVTLNYKKLADFRKAFPVHKDADSFKMV